MNCSECGSNHGKKPKIECTGSCTRADAMRAAVESRGFGESNWNSFPPLSPVLSFTLHDCTTARLQNCTTAQTEKPSLTDPRCLQKRNRRPEASSASTAVGGAARQHGPASAAGCPAAQNRLCAAELAEVAALTTRSAHTMKKKGGGACCSTAGKGEKSVRARTSRRKAGPSFQTNRGSMES